MIPKYKMKLQTTIKTIDKILAVKPDKIAFIMRHSERHFHEDARMEPFMGLTDNGKNKSMELGSTLKKHPDPQLFASSFGRCIETAYLLDKGYCNNHGKTDNTVELDIALTPFYINNIEKAIAMLVKSGTDIFLRSWFNKEIPEDIMLDPEKASQKILSFMKLKLQNLDNKKIGIFVSHDWNIFPIKEFHMGLKHEEWGNVGYLDSIFIYEKNGKYYLANHQKNAIEL